MTGLAAEWWLLYRKEMLEMARNYKWLWVPVVFLLLGVMGPVSTYYMPQILNTAGGLPEGAVIEIPTPSGAFVLAETLSNYGLIGLLILVLAGMGIVSGERNSGAAILVLVKPVRYANYITSKWAAFTTLSVASVTLGTLASWYYTDLLIGSVPAQAVLNALLIFALWLALVFAAVVFCSAALKSPAAAACLTLLSAAFLSVLTSILSGWMTWSPARLPSHAASVLIDGQPMPSLGLNAALAAALTIALLIGAVQSLRNKELAAA